MAVHAFAASLGHRPLEILFGLYNPPSASRPVAVPRPLAPLGFFVSLRVTREDGRLVYASEEPKARLKLHPDRAASYRELDPGYFHGVVFEVADLELPPGSYALDLSYTNREFRGPPEARIGSLSYRLQVRLEVA
jgi:hypothetical protein